MSAPDSFVLHYLQTTGDRPMALVLLPWEDEQEWLPTPSAAAWVDGQPEWCALVPALHAILADPGGTHPFPRYDPRWSLRQACAYWETAVYLMRFLLGWSDPARGLSAWYRQGQEDQGDARLRVLRDVWCTEGQMDLLAAWYWRGGNDDCLPAFKNLVPKLTAPAHDTELSFPDTAWWEAFHRRFTARPELPDHDPFHGGSNALHLGHTRGTAWPTQVTSCCLHAEAASQRAVLILDSAQGWYGALAVHGGRLPDLREHSWHVDVVVKTLGWLGMFRRSRTTGLWFQGRHAVHLAGTDEPTHVPG
jgi:hypothetical protein